MRGQRPWRPQIAWWTLTTSNLQRLGVGITSALGLFVVVGLTAAMQQPVFPTGATGTGLFMAAAALADGTSNPTTTGIASFNMCFNGTAWDRCKSSSTSSGTLDAGTQRVTLATNDPQFGAAGTASAEVQTVQGIASMTPLLTTLSGTNNLNNISGTISLPTGAATSANQSTGNTTLAALQTDLEADPCASSAKTKALISLVASGQIITGTSAKKTYICSLNLVTATAQNIALVEGTGTVCATGIAAMAGGTTAATGWNFAANGGLAIGNGRGTVFQADNANADNVCLLLSSTGQTSGVVMYVQK